MKNLLRSASILLFLTPCWSQFRGGYDYQATISPIQSVLHDRHVSASLEYWGSCDKPHSLDFPLINKPPSNATPPLQALREMFANDDKMQVTQDADGTIRMRESDIPRDLLYVKIAHLSFDDETRKGVPMFSPNIVLGFIIGAPEVQAYLKDHGIEKTGYALFTGPVDQDGPVTGELNNVTLSEALDYMAKTFPGLWVYENCPGYGESKRTVAFAFFRIGPELTNHTKRR